MSLSRFLRNSCFGSSLVFATLGVLTLFAPNQAQAGCSTCGGTCAAIVPIPPAVFLAPGACAVGTCTGFYCTLPPACTCAPNRFNTGCRC